VAVRLSVGGEEEGQGSGVDGGCEGTRPRHGEHSGRDELVRSIRSGGATGITDDGEKKKGETSPSGVRSRDPWTSRPADGELLVVPEAANLLIGHVIHPAGSGDVGPERRARESG